MVRILGNLLCDLGDMAASVAASQESIFTGCISGPLFFKLLPLMGLVFAIKPFGGQTCSAK